MEWILWAFKLLKSLKTLKTSEGIPRLVAKWRWILGGFAALVVADGTWEFVEARQLDKTMAALMAAPARARVLDRASDPAGDAAPSYRIAEDFARQDWARRNALGDIDSEIFALERELNRAKGHTTPPATLARLGAFVDLQADTYRALDRARELDFRGLSSDTFHQVLFWPIRSQASLRTRYLALTDQGDGAVASLLAELGLEGIERRPMAGDDLAILRCVLTDVRQDTIADVQLVLNHTTPTADALAPLAAALADADEDGQLARSFANDDAITVPTALYLANGGDRTMGAYREYLRTHEQTAGATGLLPSWVLGALGSIVRPLVLRDLRGSLRQRLAVLEAASRPWPERFDAVAAALQSVPSMRRTLGPFSAAIYPTSGGWLGPDGWNARELTLAAANQAHVRAARVAVAIERYRRDHEEGLPERLDQLVPAYLAVVPADPFTGTPLRMRTTDAGFVVYSVGQDRYDDGGLEAGTPPITMPGKPRMTGDIGVRVDTRR